MVYSDSNNEVFQSMKDSIGIQGKEGIQQIIQNSGLLDNTEQKLAFFYQAVGEGFYNLVQAFIDLDFPRFEPQKGKLPPIQLAIQQNHFDIAILLAKTFPEMLSWQADNGDTALHTAAKIGNEDLVIGLLENGARLKIENLQGNWPTDEAKNSGHAALAKKMKRWQQAKEKKKLKALKTKLSEAGEEITVLRNQVTQLNQTNSNLKTSNLQLSASLETIQAQVNEEKASMEQELIQFRSKDEEYGVKFKNLETGKLLIDAVAKKQKELSSKVEEFDDLKQEIATFKEKFAEEQTTEGLRTNFSRLFKEQEKIQEEVNKISQLSTSTKVKVEQAEKGIQHQFSLYAQRGEVESFKYEITTGTESLIQAFRNELEPLKDNLGKFWAEANCGKQTNEELRQQLVASLQVIDQTETNLKKYIWEMTEWAKTISPPLQASIVAAEQKLAQRVQHSVRALEQRLNSQVAPLSQNIERTSNEAKEFNAAFTRYQQGTKVIYGIFKKAAPKGWNLTRQTNFRAIKNIIKILPMADNSIIIAWKKDETSIRLEKLSLNLSVCIWSIPITIDPSRVDDRDNLFLAPNQEKLYFLLAGQFANFGLYTINLYTGKIEKSILEIKAFQHISKEEIIFIYSYSNDIAIFNLNTGNITKKLSENYYLGSSILKLQYISDEKIIFDSFRGEVFSKNTRTSLAPQAQGNGGTIMYPLYKWNLKTQQCTPLPITLSIEEGEEIQEFCTKLGNDLWEIHSERNTYIWVDIKQEKLIKPEEVPNRKPYQHVITHYQSLGTYTATQTITVKTNWEHYEYKNAWHSHAESIDYSCDLIHNESQATLLTFKDEIDIDSNPLVLISDSLFAGVCLADKTIKIWNLNTKACIDAFPSQGVEYLAVPAPGELMGFTKDGKIYKWTNLDLACQAVEEVHPECKVM